MSYKSIFSTFCGQFNDYYMAQIGKKQGDKGNLSVILQCFLIHGQNCDEWLSYQTSVGWLL